MKQSISLAIGFAAIAMFLCRAGAQQPADTVGGLSRPAPCANLAPERGAQSMGIINILRREWFVSCRQMTAIADAMPEDKFEYRPVPEVRSYGGIVAHIAGEHQTWFEVLNGAAKVDSMEQFDKLAERYDGLKTKAEALKALNDSYEYGGKYLAGLDEHTAMESPGKLFPISPTWFCIEQTVQHSKEHYGNLVTYLRLNHIVPPASR